MALLTVSTALTDIIANVTAIVTAAVGWIGSFAGVFTTSGNEILLVFIALPMVGLGVGLLKRLISVG